MDCEQQPETDQSMSRLLHILFCFCTTSFGVYSFGKCSRSYGMCLLKDRASACSAPQKVWTSERESLGKPKTPPPLPLCGGLVHSVACCCRENIKSFTCKVEILPYWM